MQQEVQRKTSQNIVPVRSPVQKNFSGQRNCTFANVMIPNSYSEALWLWRAWPERWHDDYSRLSYSAAWVLGRFLMQFLMQGLWNVEIEGQLWF
jgi:hypothetical protein